MFKKGRRMKNSDNTIEQFNLITKNKRNIIIISSVLLVIVIIGVMYALFSNIVKETAPVITSGFASVALQEDSPFDTNIPEDGVETSIKTFRAISTGTVDAYIRAKIIPVVEYFDADENAWVVANVSVNDIELEKTAPDWIESNGYYYSISFNFLCIIKFFSV